jgi:tRNA nucleotidyltransferase (CCA-adding enzyme)
MVPTTAGPVDVTSFRRGPTLEDDLAHRDFTINAMAWDPRAQRLHDPFGGREDLARRRLRAVGDPAERFAEDPLRALRGARLAAVLSLETTPELEGAMAGCVEALRRVARERVRHELAALLLAPDAARGLALLRRTGLEADLAPGAAPDAAAVVPHLPADLELRLAAWLRGARHGSILRSLRFSRRTVERVERLLRAHPVEAGVDAARDGSVRRMLKRVGTREAGLLVALRRAELTRGEAAAHDDARAGLLALDAVEEALRRVRRAGQLALRRQDLAIDGQEVMRLLGRGPGPAVGRALRYLADQVIEDPARNTPETLRALLERWAGSSEGLGKP